MASTIHKLDDKCDQSLIIGDIHGRFDLLNGAFELLYSLVDNIPTNLILLGDYIDKGPNSKLVIEKLMHEFSGTPFALNHVALMGNHEQMAIYAHDFGIFDPWIENGGKATLQSYNGKSIDEATLRFIKQMPLIAEDKNGIYVHAGINPKDDAKDDNQYPSCLWIREEFYKSVASMNYPKPIIYGHTPRHRPMIHRDEYGIVVAVGIDTGAEFSDNLTLLQITNEPEGRQCFTTWNIGPKQTKPSSLFW